MMQTTTGIKDRMVEKSARETRASGVIRMLDFSICSLMSGEDFAIFFPWDPKIL